MWTGPRQPSVGPVSTVHAQSCKPVNSSESAASKPSVCSLASAPASQLPLADTQRTPYAASRLKTTPSSNADGRSLVRHG